MMTGLLDLAQVRLDNALILFEEFVRQAARHADAATLRGLERRFAERVQIQPSYWSQIKSRSRQIGERLARQFEHLCQKPRGWMDLPHPAGTASDGEVAGDASSDGRSFEPRDDDERFILGLVLTYYRRHPQRARGRLLDLLSEVLVPVNEPTSASRVASGQRLAPSAPVGRESHHAQTADGNDLWLRSKVGVAPLKPRK